MWVKLNIPNGFPAPDTPPSHPTHTRKKRPQAIGRSRGGLSTKIHAAVDALGNPVRCLLTGGQVPDVTQAEPLLENLPIQQVVADKGYDSQQLIDWIHARQGQANIPARAGNHYPRDFDAPEYQARNLVERFFNRIKHFRRIATRYEKLDVRIVDPEIWTRV